MQKALEEDRIFPVFQAQQPIDEQHIVGLESLARARSTEGLIVLPHVLIPAALHQNRMNEMHQRVTQLACAFASDKDVDLSINIHPDVLLHSRFDEVIEQILRETRLDAHRLIVEILEMTSRDDMQKARGRLRSLFGKSTKKPKRQQLRGIRAAADDLPEASSEQVLRELQKQGRADEVKIDWHLVRNMNQSGDMRNGQIRKKVQQVIEKARKAGATVVFEGVEPGDFALRQQLADLHPRMKGRLLVQVGKPEPAEKMAAILRGEQSLQRFSENL